MGESREDALHAGFEGSVGLEFHGATVSSDGGLPAANVAPTIAIERPKTAANAPEGATTRAAIEAGKALDAACADVGKHKTADDSRRQKRNWKIQTKAL